MTLLRNTMMVAALAVAVGLASMSVAASKTEKSQQLVNLHDLKCSTAIGDYFLKQESVLAARAYLDRIGREQGLGRDWNPADPNWKQAEGMIVASLMRQVHRSFSNMEWLSEEWHQLNDRELSEVEMDALLQHFGTDVGRKQLIIVDHSVAFHVMASLSLAGKIQDNVPGTEAERKRMQDTYYAEDQAMRFDHNENPEGTRFAFSPVGKKYFTNAVLKVSGLITRRLYESARQIPGEIDGAAPAEVQAAIDAYRRGRPG